MYIFPCFYIFYCFYVSVPPSGVIKIDWLCQLIEPRLGVTTVKSCGVSSLVIFCSTSNYCQCNSDKLFFFFIGELQSGALPYWRLDAKRPYLLPSSKPCGPCSSRTEGRSSSIVLSQVVLGRPTGLLQSAYGLSVAAVTRWWSSSGAIRARCPKKLSRCDLTQPDTGEQVVMLCTVSLVVNCHHNNPSNAS